MAFKFGTHNPSSWVFFAANAKPSSMRRALAERLAERESMVIIDQPVSIFRDRKIPGLEERVKPLPIAEGSWHYQPLHFPEKISGLGNVIKQLNQYRLHHELNQLLPKNRKRIVCYDSPTQAQLVGKLEEDLSVYVAVDEKTLTVWGEPIQGEVELERRLLSRVDRVICVSETLAEVLRSRTPSGRTFAIQVLTNGYDERIFDPRRNYLEPTDLASVPRPRILVAGHISERIDWDGITRTSELRPQCTWVFVGPADQTLPEKIQRDLGVRGFYHPPIPLTEVPAWINHCDACAVPYRLNPFTCASNPLKAIEYLAMGAPVLSTRIPSLERYDGSIEWVNEGDGESYARALDRFSNQAGSRNIRDLRQRSVSGDSWGVKVNHFRNILFNDIP